MLPPFIASAAAAGKARRGGGPFALLIADHRELERILDDMVSQSSNSTARRSASFLMLKRKHAVAEEHVVTRSWMDKGTMSRKVNTCTI
jgi:hypothetical protein